MFIERRIYRRSYVWQIKTDRSLPRRLLRIVKRLLYLVSASRKQRSSLIGQRLFRAFESRSCCVRGERRKGSDFPPTSTPFGLRYLCPRYMRHSDKYIARSYSVWDICERFFSATHRYRVVTTELFARTNKIINYAVYLGRVKLYK